MQFIQAAPVCAYVFVQNAAMVCVRVFCSTRMCLWTMCHRPQTKRPTTRRQVKRFRGSCLRYAIVRMSDVGTSSCQPMTDSIFEILINSLDGVKLIPLLNHVPTKGASTFLREKITKNQRLVCGPFFRHKLPQPITYISIAFYSFYFRLFEMVRNECDANCVRFGQRKNCVLTAMKLFHSIVCVRVVCVSRVRVTLFLFLAACHAILGACASTHTHTRPIGFFQVVLRKQRVRELRACMCVCEYVHRHR